MISAKESFHYKTSIESFFAQHLLLFTWFYRSERENSLLSYSLPLYKEQRMILLRTTTSLILLTTTKMWKILKPLFEKQRYQELFTPFGQKKLVDANNDIFALIFFFSWKNKRWAYACHVQTMKKFSVCNCFSVESDVTSGIKSEEERKKN